MPARIASVTNRSDFAYPRRASAGGFKVRDMFLLDPRHCISSEPGTFVNDTEINRVRQYPALPVEFSREIMQLQSPADRAARKAALGNATICNGRRSRSSPAKDAAHARSPAALELATAGPPGH